eukprot:COSAG06_NODE_50168_length_320_cov_1.108597_1_plen_26_part_10
MGWGSIPAGVLCFIGANSILQGNEFV